MARLELEQTTIGSLWRLQQKDGLVIALLLTLLALVVHLVFFKRVRHFPPGPWPWPLVGNLFLLGSSPHQSFAELAKKYGPLMYLRLGCHHTIVVSSPEMAKEFFMTHDHVFQYRRQTTNSKILSDHQNIATSNGHIWRQLRKIFVTELLSSKRIHSSQVVRMKEIRSTMKDINIAAQEGKVVDLDFQLASLSTNIMTEMAFKKRYFGVDEKGQKEARHFKQIVDDSFGAFAILIIGDYVPSLWWVDKLKGVEAPLRELSKRMKQFAQGIIDEHRRDHATTNQDSSYDDKPKDFLDVLLSEHLEDGTGKLSDETIQAVLYDILAAGTTTTSTTLEWAMAELLRNPKLMKRAQVELDTVVGTNRVIEESDLQHLPYLQAIIKETFRFHPAGPLGVPHMSMEACEVAGYNLPPKTRVIVNLWAMGHNPNVWGRPLEFDPERFMEQPETDWNGKNFELLPFGTGRRACPGRPLAGLVIQLALAHLLHSFDWSLPNEQEPDTLDMSEKFGLTLPRAQPLHAVAHPRLPTHLY